MTWYVYGCKKCKIPASIRPAETRNGKRPANFKCLVCNKTTAVKTAFFSSNDYEAVQDFVRKYKLKLYKATE